MQLALFISFNSFQLLTTVVSRHLGTLMVMATRDDSIAANVMNGRMPVEIHWSAFALAVSITVLAFWLLGTLTSDAWIWLSIASVITVVGVLGSLVLHEYAHAFVARRFGFTVEKATFNAAAFAVHIDIDDKDFYHPKVALVLLAGPAVNISIAFIAFFVATLLTALGTVPESLIFSLYAVSIGSGLLGAANLVPVRPTDGHGVLIRILPNFAVLTIEYSLLLAAVVVIVLFKIHVFSLIALVILVMPLLTLMFKADPPPDQKTAD